jgi:hypothetical protein
MHVTSLGVHPTVYYRHVLRLLPRMGVVSLKRLRMDRVLDRGNDRQTALQGTRTPGRLRLPPAKDKPRGFRLRTRADGVAHPARVVRAGGLARSNNNLAARRPGCHTPAVTGRAGCRLSAPDQPVPASIPAHFPTHRRGLGDRPPTHLSRRPRPPFRAARRPAHAPRAWPHALAPRGRHAPAHQQGSSPVTALAAPPQARDHALTYEPARPPRQQSLYYELCT